MPECKGCWCLISKDELCDSCGYCLYNCCDCD